MNAGNQSDDIGAIEALIARQFESLNWIDGRAPDWAAFAGDFAADATLYPSARPARSQTVDTFIARMSGLVGSQLHAFHEKVLGIEVCVFGTVAVATAACEVTENGSNVNRSVEMMLLVKSDGAWRIVSQAWDMEDGEKPIPPHLIGPFAVR